MSLTAISLLCSVCVNFTQMEALLLTPPSENETVSPDGCVLNSMRTMKLNKNVFVPLPSAQLSDLPIPDLRGRTWDSAFSQLEAVLMIRQAWTMGLIL